MPIYKSLIQDQLSHCLEKTDLGMGERIQGKVRDSYILPDKMVFVTTDRQSAFDRVLASIPFKGQVLNQTSAWWFDRTRHIIPNHVLSIPDPNVTVGKRCEVFPVEFVMRGYITGSTSTSLWTVYKNGDRNYCGNALPEGLVKNQKLEKNLITPTTKDAVHDRPISPEEIVSEGWMSREDWDYASLKAEELFEYGQKIAQKHGLILVDTKYEMGKDENGVITLIDEIHTPDSSRYWIAESYDERFAAGEEPQNIDKEFLRLWFKDHCDPYNDAVLPPAPDELVVELSRRYIQLYEMITGESFQFPNPAIPIEERIRHNLTGLSS
ncbi:MAG TPA: phosphoribosylaminoimidazolesuccinocarboxamide synthase [Candidatus Marinimicrobia bacterium]|nr:MAG: phosphoribosylaminoimidazolesuccinocarboxamide synthase [Candidatus Marinimicrobia bacterium CG1_02_48_14]HCW75319.1 phosphoribosylaminoimidazolesuccinocarboxamide synthase [Candidatus Neomarinimicrobiota bacterium]